MLAVATTAPAGNRNPLSQLAASPGPTSVTGGGTVALTASLVNRESSTFTDIRFFLPIPAGAAVHSSSCPSSDVTTSQNGPQFVCNWGHQLPSGQTATVVVALDTPYVLRPSVAPTKIATYGETGAVMHVLVDVLLGRVRAPGRLPVTVHGVQRTGC